VICSILLLLETSARWHGLASDYPNPSAKWPRHHRRNDDDVLVHIWSTFIDLLDGRAGSGVRYSLLTRRCFCRGRTGRSDTRSPNRRRCLECRALTERQGPPVRMTIASASRRRTSLLQARLTPRLQNPTPPLATEGATTGPLTECMAAHGIVLTGPT